MLVALVMSGSAASAASVRLFPLERTTGEKPQSKIFHHDDTFWAVLSGSDGLGLYERQGDRWVLHLALGDAGKADVKLAGSTAYVLVFSSAPVLYVLDYDDDSAAWTGRTTEAVSVPKIHASEALVLERDSTGRLWHTAEGDGDIQVFYSTASDGSAWSNEPLVLETGVDGDDIASVVAFGGDKIGVFWSDQNRGAFGFRVHHDGDPPDRWGAPETVFAGPANADDHLNLAADSQGRVFAVTKDAHDRLHVHRRSVDGTWTTVRDVSGSASNRGVIMVDETDQNVWLLYANQARSPSVIEYRRADTNTLSFGEPIEFIAAPSDLDDVSALKQPLPVGSLVAVATDADQYGWWNALDPPDPSGLISHRVPSGSGADDNESGVLLRWDAPGLGAPESYRVYRREPGGSFVRIDQAAVYENVYLDSDAPADFLCYRVTAVRGGTESAPTNETCIDLAPTDPSARLRLQIRPNPFNPRTRIRFHLTHPTHVRVSLYDMLGRLVTTLASREFAAADPVVEWNGLDRAGRPAPAGSYLLTLQAEGHVEVRKVTLLK